MTAKRRVAWNEVWEEWWAVGLVAALVVFFVAVGLISPRGVEWLEIAKVVAIAAAVIATSKLRREWVTGAAMLAALALVGLALAAMERGRWVEAVILAATVVLTLRLANGAAR
jgi:hypothetical protein